MTGSAYSGVHIGEGCCGVRAGSFKGDIPCARCRYGYSSLKQLNRVLDSYAYARIPLETFVTDSQYMNHDQDFTLGTEFNVSTFQVTGIAGLQGTCSASMRFSMHRGGRAVLCHGPRSRWGVL